MKRVILKKTNINLNILCTVYFYLLCMYENNNVGQENILERNLFPFNCTVGFIVFIVE
jgi:hypothetical protein